jgi:hypothetical protein
LQPVFAPPQRPWHECSGIEHALRDWQSPAALHPHTPLTHALLFAWPAQLTQAPPFVPHAEAAVPVTHVPEEQHPPLQSVEEVHDVVHVPPLHAYPGGQSEVRTQLIEQCPPWHVAPPWHAYVEPQPPQLFLSLVKSTHAPLQRLKPLLHAIEQAPDAHAGWALDTLVVQVPPQWPQFFGSVDVSTHAPPQREGVGAGQPDAHV